MAFRFLLFKDRYKFIANRSVYYITFNKYGINKKIYSKSNFLYYRKVFIRYSYYY